MRMTITMMPAIYREKRRGVATMWLLAGLPVLLVLFFFLIELGHLWAARVELENSLEAAALAAVKEWGENGGSPALNWTSTARNRGVTLAGANSINGIPVVIGTNLGNLDPNENAAYVPGVGATGNLVFGTVTEMGTTVTFDATNPPECGGALVLVDASGSGNLFSGSRNEWGISFQAATVPTLRITRVEINVATMTAPSVFDGLAALDTAVDTASTAAVKYSGGGAPFQQDNDGFAVLANNMLSGQIVASYPSTQVLRLNFSAGGLDDGFAPGDRFRFAQAVKANVGGAQRDGDDVGGNGTTGGATITIYFNNGDIVSKQLRDTMDTGQVVPIFPDVIPIISPITGSYIVSPAEYPPGIPDLPQAPTAAANNNGQSYVRFTGGAGASTEYFGVRAQATISVPSLFGSYLGALYSLHNVTVDTTAIYDCDDGRTRLVRVDNYLHP